MGGNRLIRTIRLDDEKITRILGRIDSETQGAASSRSAARFKYRIKALVVHMQQPGFAEPVPFLVPSRDISSSGLSFLHGGYVHVGTRCLCQLITSCGTWTNVVGRVVRCGFVEGSVHDVGIRFDQGIDPTVFCAEAVRRRVLLAEDDASVTKLATFHLQQLHVEVTHAGTGQEAIDFAMKQTFDLILLDMDMPVMDGFAAVAELRKRGYVGRVVAAVVDKCDQDRCVAAGCNQCIVKPYSRNDLSQLLMVVRDDPDTDKLAKPCTQRRAPSGGSKARGASREEPGADETKKSPSQPPATSKPVESKAG